MLRAASFRRRRARHRGWLAVSRRAQTAAKPRWTVVGSLEAGEGAHRRRASSLSRRRRGLPGRSPAPGLLAAALCLSESSHAGPHLRTRQAERFAAALHRRIGSRTACSLVPLHPMHPSSRARGYHSISSGPAQPSERHPWPAIAPCQAALALSRPWTSRTSTSEAHRPYTPLVLATRARYLEAEMRWYLVVVVVALSTSWARSAPLPPDGGASNPKNPDNASLPTASASSSTAVVDPVAAALSSKLAQISSAIGKLPVLSLPSALMPLKTRRTKVVAPFLVVMNVKGAPARRRSSLAISLEARTDPLLLLSLLRPNLAALKPAPSRRAVEERAVNPKRPRPTSQTRTTRIFGSTTVPVKVPVTSSTPPGNPKHAFVPSPVVKIVSYTYTAAGGGATTVVEAQGSRTHPGRPKRALLSRALSLALAVPR